MSALRFELKARDGLARIGELHTRHGVISTPALLPVVNPNLRDITPSQLRDEFGFSAVITNSYIIRRGDELRERALKEGLHKLLAFDGPIMTDSGTFQQHVYGDVSATNAEIVRFQLDIGSDIVTPLDLFTEPDEPLAKAQSDWAETLKRYREAFTIDNPQGSLLACAVQGGSHLAVRRRAAEDLGSLPPGVHPVGGIVPLMEGERYPLLTDVIATAKSALSPSRPVHLFGAGHPLVIPMAVLLGCDLFDSSSYAKYAKDGRMIYSEGTRSLTDLVENPCACPICHAHTPAELRALESGPRYLALLRHNLHVLSSEMRRVRQAIREESVWELAEERARANPHVFEALRRIALHADLLEEAEPLSRMRAVRYFDATSAIRPLVERSRQRALDRASPIGPRAVLVRPRGTPYTKRVPMGLSKERKRAHVPLVFETVWGPVPEHLDECFPFAQTVAPGALDAESASRVARATEAFVRFHPKTAFLRYEDAKLPQIQAEFVDPPPSKAQEDRARVAAILRYQFGQEAAAVLDTGALVVERSRRTGKMRRVLIGGAHALSMRAHDGLFSLTFEGGRLLHNVLPLPRHRACVEPETAPFNAEGRSVFSKFVVSMDPALRPGDEVLVVSGVNLVAVGQVLLTAREAAAFKHGVAIPVREGQKSARGEAPEKE